jgi:hypothetical protein
MSRSESSGLFDPFAGGRALIQKNAFGSPILAGLFFASVGFFPASRLLKNAYKQFLRG